MNYLAHAVLAEPYAHSIVGNLAGDLVKGPVEAHVLHPRVTDGVRRHRRVDVLTDRHPAQAALRARFPGAHRRYAGIVLDVLFDYFLSTDWHLLYGHEQDAFVEGIYTTLRDRAELLPAPLAEVAPRWVAADWLRVYRSLEGVDAVMDRLAARLRDPDALRRAWRHVRADAQGLRGGFHTVFRDVRASLDGMPAPAARPGSRRN